MKKIKAPIPETKEVLIRFGQRRGLIIEYYVGEKKVSPFTFVKSENVDITTSWNKQQIGSRFTSNLPFERKIELNGQARELGIPFLVIGYEMFLEKFKK